MTRKEFLLGAAGLSIGAVVASACGGEGGTTTGDMAKGGTGDMATGGTTCANPTATIGSNHGHALTLTTAQVDAGAASTMPTSFDLTGGGHTHGVTLAQSDFTTLKSGQSVTKTSTSSSGHTHSIAISC